MTTKKTKPSADELLTLIASKAPELRKAGVKTVTLDGEGFRVELAPHVDETPPPRKTEETVIEPASPWEDPETYGLAPGSPVPGFTRPKGKE